jgi:hypothetical protein
MVTGPASFEDRKSRMSGLQRPSFRCKTSGASFSFVSSSVEGQP